MLRKSIAKDYVGSGAARTNLKMFTAGCVNYKRLRFEKGRAGYTIKKRFAT